LYNQELIRVYRGNSSVPFAVESITPAKLNGYTDLPQRQKWVSPCTHWEKTKSSTKKVSKSSKKVTKYDTISKVEINRMKLKLA